MTKQEIQHRYGDVLSTKVLYGCMDKDGYVSTYWFYDIKDLKAYIDREKDEHNYKYIIKKVESYDLVGGLE